MARTFAYLGAAGLLTALGLVAAAPAATAAPAHASLVATNPADGSIVAREPARVTATFNEAVEISPDSMQVFAPNGDRADTGVTAHSRWAREIAATLRPGLGDGTYTVGWHVISDDSHPVQGTFIFSIGAPSSTAANPAAIGQTASALTDFAFGVVRWVAFGSFALLIGAVAFVIWCWPAGAARRPVLRLTMGAWGALAFSVLAAVLLQGVYGARQGIGHVFLPNVLHATLYSRYGRAVGVRLLLVIAALFVFTTTLAGLPAADRRARSTAGVAWGVLTAALAATWAVADHAGFGIQVPLAVPADIIHLSAMAVWLGGLAVLATIVLRRPSPPVPRSAGGAARRRDEPAPAEAALAVTRFSPIALGCVVAILVTGTYQAWRGVGTPGALAGTTYGRLLLVKIAGMCALIALGYVARRRIAEGLRAPAAAQAAAGAVTAAASPVKAGAGVRSGQAKAGQGARQGGPSAAASRQGGAGPRQSGAGPRQGGLRPGGPGARQDGGSAGAKRGPDRLTVTLARLRWSVAAEVLIAATVLAVTAVLVNTPTGRETFTRPAAAAAFDTGGPGGRGDIAVTVTPARPGANQVRLPVTGSAGGIYLPQRIRAALWLPARHLGPLPVRLAPMAPDATLAGPSPSRRPGCGGCGPPSAATPAAKPR